jgi:cell growth-regulating nucleolar protein
MVSFVCDVCQETLKKPKLDSHKSRCHNAIFSCIDCYKTFSGTEYKNHTSCITEVEKYHKKSRIETFLKPKGEPLVKSLSNKLIEEKKELDSTKKNDLNDEQLLMKTLKKKSVGYQKICKKFSTKGKDFNALLSKATFLLENDTIKLKF